MRRDNVINCKVQVPVNAKTVISEGENMFQVFNLFSV